jgi:hypothetical protein
MKTRKLVLTVFDLIIVLLILYGCGPAPSAAPIRAPTAALPQAPTQEPSQMTLTFSGDTCAYSGPKSIPFGKFTVNLVKEGNADTTYAFTIVTLKEGKTLADLQAGSSPDRPDCVKVDFLNANSHSIKSGSKKDEIDLTANAAFGDDPFYFVCFAAPPERKIGAFGPVVVVK